MFQTHVDEKMYFLSAEPKRGRSSGDSHGHSHKKNKKRTPIEKYLRKLTKALNKVSALSSQYTPEQLGILRNLQSYLHVMNRIKSASGRIERFRELVLQFEQITQPNADLLKLVRVSHKPLPDEVVELSRPDSSDEDVSMHGVSPRGPSVAPSGPAALSSVPSPHVPSPALSSVPSPHVPSIVPSPHVPSPVTSDPVAKTSTQTPVKRRHRRGVGPKVGDIVRVTLLPSTKKIKDNKLTRLLKKGPQELEVRGIGAGTLSFVVNNKGIKSSTVTIEKERVSMEKIESISKPDKLLPHMLLEMRWEGDPKYYSVRYTPSSDGVQSVTFLEDGSLYTFDAENDDWRYPRYHRFELEDHVVINGRKAVVTDEISDHELVFEWLDRKKGEPKNFVLDLWYTIIKPLIAADNTSEAEIESEEEEPDHSFSLNEIVSVKGVRYKVFEIIESEDGVKYKLKSRDGNEIGPVAEDVLTNQWEPAYDLGDDVVINGKPGSVHSIDHEHRRYIVYYDDNDEVPVSIDEKSLKPLELLPLDVGSDVFYNYGFFKIVENRHTYTLEDESGSTKLTGITQDDLDGWFGHLNKKTKTFKIYKFLKSKELKKKGKYETYYEGIDKDGNKKNIQLTNEIKHQEEASNFFLDAAAKDDDLDERIVFVPGESVIIIGSDKHSKVGKVVEHIVTDEISDEKYKVEVDGSIKEYKAGQLDKLSSSPKKEQESLGDKVTDKDGNVWELVRFDGTKAVWEMEESGSESESESEIESDFDSDNEEEATFKDGSYVTVLNSTEVYRVISSKNEVYHLVSVKNDENEVEDVVVENLHAFNPQYSVGQHLDFDGKEVIVAEVDDDGEYIFKNGESAWEDELSEWIPLFKKGTIVIEVGSPIVYKVVSVKDGEYKLSALFDGAEVQVEVDNVSLKESPEFAVNEYVQLKNEEYPRKIKKFNKKNWTYELEGLPGKVFREMELGEQRYEPEFEEGQVVFLTDANGNPGSVGYEIVQVHLESGSYKLKNFDRLAHEDELVLAPEELQKD